MLTKKIRMCYTINRFYKGGKNMEKYNHENITDEKAIKELIIHYIMERLEGMRDEAESGIKYNNEKENEIIEEINKRNNSIFRIFQLAKIDNLEDEREILASETLRNAGIKETIEYLQGHITEADVKAFIFDEPNSQGSSLFESLFKNLKIDYLDLIEEVLISVHYDKMKEADREGDFFDEDKAPNRFKFLDASFIGFDEFKKYFEIAKPIFEKLGMGWRCSEEELKQRYSDMVRYSLEKRGIKTEEDLLEFIQNPDYGTDKLDENGLKRLELQKDSKVAEQMAKQTLEHNPEIVAFFEKNREQNNVQLKKQTFLGKIISKIWRKASPNISTSQKGQTFEKRREAFSERTRKIGASESNQEQTTSTSEQQAHDEEHTSPTEQDEVKY